MELADHRQFYCVCLHTSYCHLAHSLVASAIVHVQLSSLCSEVAAPAPSIAAVDVWSLNAPKPENVTIRPPLALGIVVASFRFEPLQFTLFIDIKSTRNSSISSGNVFSPQLAASSFFFPVSMLFMFVRICGYFLFFLLLLELVARLQSHTVLYYATQKEKRTKRHERMKRKKNGIK